jgi:hypothetical protein
MSSPPLIIKVSGSRSSTPDITIIKIEDEQMDASPVAPLRRKITDRSRGTRSDREIYLEEEVTRLTSKRLEYKNKLQTLKKQLNNAIIEKEVTSQKAAINQQLNDQKLQELKQRNQVLSNADKPESFPTVFCSSVMFRNVTGES